MGGFSGLLQGKKGERKVETGELPEFEQDMSDSPSQITIKVFMHINKTLKLWQSNGLWDVLLVGFLFNCKHAAASTV